jgi:hypothetical protein
LDNERFGYLDSFSAGPFWSDPINTHFLLETRRV